MCCSTKIEFVGKSVNLQPVELKWKNYCKRCDNFFPSDRWQGHKQHTPILECPISRASWACTVWSQVFLCTWLFLHRLKQTSMADILCGMCWLVYPTKDALWRACHQHLEAIPWHYFIPNKTFNVKNACISLHAIACHLRSGFVWMHCSAWRLVSSTIFSNRSSGQRRRKKSKAVPSSGTCEVGPVRLTNSSTWTGELSIVQCRCALAFTLRNWNIRFIT